MGQALLVNRDNTTLKSHPNLNVQKGAFTYKVETRGDDATYSVSDGVRTLSVPIHWTFGQGMQTWVFERNGKYYESLVSYYPSLKGLGTTVGDERLVPQNLEEALGRELKHGDTKDCFACHTTNAVNQGKLTVESMQAGVTCEHCHAGASTHLYDAMQGVYDTAPRNLKKLSSEEISNFCGQCHRSWETVVRNRTLGEVNVRFQPYRLANSKCFNGADPRISCVACHDPHQNIVRDDASYDGNCLACHATKSKTSASVKTSAMTTPAVGENHGNVGVHPDAKACPVGTANCVSCHMPKVKLPGGLITFTDHEIRVVKAGAPYPD